VKGAKNGGEKVPRAGVRVGGADRIRSPKAHGKSKTQKNGHRGKRGEICIVEKEERSGIPGGFEEKTGERGETRGGRVGETPRTFR